MPGKRVEKNNLQNTSKLGSLYKLQVERHDGYKAFKG